MKLFRNEGFTRRSLRPFRQTVIWKVALAMVAVLVVYALLLFPVESLFNLTNESQTAGAVSDYIGYILILIVPFIFFTQIEHEGLYAEEIKSKKLLRFLRTVFSVVLIIYGFMLFEKAILIFAGQANSVYSAASNFVQTTNFDVSVNPWLFIVFDFILAVTIVPLLEEVLYRGLLIGKLTEWIDLKWAVVASAIIFAIFHANPIAGFLLGLALGLIYVNSRSLVIAVLCHAFYNLVMIIFSILRHTGVYDPRLVEFSSGWPEFLIGIIALAFGTLLFYRFLRRYWIKKEFV